MEQGVQYVDAAVGDYSLSAGVTLPHSYPGVVPVQLAVLLRPRAWAAHALVVAAVAATIALGLWQLSAWESAREAEARDLSGARPIALNDAMSGDQPFPGQYVGQPVTLSGTWLPESTLYVADRGREGERGYWVMTPVQVDGSDDGLGGPSAMPVVRGWTPEPTAEPVSGEVRLTAWLQPSEGSNLPDPPGEDVIAEMRVASVTQYLDMDLYSGFAVSQEPSAGLASVTPEQIPSISPVTSLKNLLYAIQWWVFGVFALYIWQRWCRDQIELERAEAEAEAAPEDQPVGSSA